jgi:hypothetical protein
MLVNVSVSGFSIGFRVKKKAGFRPPYSENPHFGTEPQNCFALAKAVFLT